MIYVPISSLVSLQHADAVCQSRTVPGESCLLEERMAPFWWDLGPLAPSSAFVHAATFPTGVP